MPAESYGRQLVAPRVVLDGGAPQSEQVGDLARVKQVFALERAVTPRSVAVRLRRVDRHLRHQNDETRSSPPSDHEPSASHTADLITYRLSSAPVASVTAPLALTAHTHLPDCFPN